MEQEIWKDIEGYEGLYKVSNLGNVKSLKYSKERILKAGDDGYGYLQVNLCKEGNKKTLKIHRLVALAFIENPNNMPEINHKDEDKTNNSAYNLEWCDRTYNINHGMRNKRVAKALSKRVLCVESGIVYPSAHEVQRQLGFNQGSISSCCNGRYNQAYGYTWRYA